MQTLGLSDSTPKPTSRLKDLFGPDLCNEVSALTVCHTASLACFVVAGLTTALAIFTNPAGLFDAGLYVWAYAEPSAPPPSRGSCFNIIEQIASAATGRVPSVVAVFITVILFNSIRAAYAYQRFRRTPPSTAPAQPAV